MIADIGSILAMWPRSGFAFAFRRRQSWSRLPAGTTGGRRLSWPRWVSDL